jgi:NADPH:quinone reductase-like Zn-dependent oxidoreductase
VNAQADPSAFKRFVATAGEGNVRVTVTRVVPLEELPEALSETVSGSARGKLVASLER